MFNWLAPHIAGAHCLDLFAGSGILSFEALSRGAASAVAIDSDTHTCQQIRRMRESLDCDSLEVIATDAIAWIQDHPQSTSSDTPFSVVFIDPPFHCNWLPRVTEALVSHPNVLTDDALIYLERAKTEPFTAPECWTQKKSKTSGQVTFELYERSDVVQP